MKSENEISAIVLDSAIAVHKSLGPGLLESAYEECLSFELHDRGLEIVRQYPIPLLYRNVKLDCSYRADVLVEKRVLVEIKSIETLEGIHTAQVLTYLRLSGLKLGLLINFNVTLLKDGFHRIVLGMKD
ncbi:MAG: GxxExxY protein [Flavobacteriales bacterium]|nr:GxxExxY protein [Flavobacteriales bacterium]